MFLQKDSVTKLTALLMPLYALMPLTVLADSQDTLNFVSGVSTRYDDNLFRQFSNERSDIINQLYVGARIDKQYSLQRFKLNARFTRNLYKDNDFLDWNNKQYEGAWIWSITPRLTGTVSASRSESLINFNDLQIDASNEQSARNIQTNRRESFLFDYNAFGGWHLLGGASRLKQENAQSFNQNPSFTSKAVDFGVSYQFRSGSSIKVMNHVRRGNNDDRSVDNNAIFDNNYREKETDVTLNWLLSAKSRVTADIGYYKREHDTLSYRDFSGFQGGLGYRWTPTGKIQVNVDLTSNLSNFQQIDSSYTRQTTFRIRPVYQYSPKITFDGGFVYAKRDFEGSNAIDPTTGLTLSSADPRTEDDLYSISVGANWQPREYATLGIQLRHEKNDSNLDAFDYKAKSATISGNFVF